MTKLNSKTIAIAAVVLAAVLFIALTLPMTRFADWVQLRMRRRRTLGSTA